MKQTRCSLYTSLLFGWTKPDMLVGFRDEVVGGLWYLWTQQGLPSLPNMFTCTDISVALIVSSNSLKHEYDSGLFDRWSSYLFVSSTQIKYRTGVEWQTEHLGGGYLKKDIWLPDQYVPITLSEEFLYIKEKCEGTSGVALCLKTRVSIWRSGKKSQDLERKWANEPRSAVIASVWTSPFTLIFVCLEGVFLLYWITDLRMERKMEEKRQWFVLLDFNPWHCD